MKSGLPPANMGTNMKRWIRKLHRWGGLLTLVPLFIVIVTGLLLQVKKQVPWVQPPTQRGTQDRPILTFEEILSIVATVPEAEVAAWQDVEKVTPLLMVFKSPPDAEAIHQFLGSFALTAMAVIRPLMFAGPTDLQRI